MGYRIISRDKNQSRGEGWDNKSYPTREKAKKEIKRAILWMKKSKYLRNNKTTFKIVKDRMERNRSSRSGYSFNDLMRM